MPDIKPVYLPHDEPYLGQPHLLAFDKAIPDAMRTNIEVARRTFIKPLSPLQVAATEIIPQGTSIALSIRELIRQAYLYSAAILIRPLIERAGTIYYLRAHPAAPADIQEAFRTMLQKLVHSDPAGSVYNMFDRHDGVSCSPAAR
jgi:hypothetical protein